jgi:hypothetical protein
VTAQTVRDRISYFQSNSYQRRGHLTVSKFGSYMLTLPRSEKHTIFATMIIPFAKIPFPQNFALVCRLIYKNTTAHSDYTNAKVFLDVFGC